MAEDTARMNPVSPQGSILWAEDNALARAMGISEYLGHVRGTGLGPLPARSTSHSSTLASCLSQDPAYVSKMNSMKAHLHELQEEKRITNERMATNDQMIADLKRIIERVASNAAAGNTLATQDTESPGVMRARSSVASRPS
jgi:hypothetical protein